MIGKLLSYFATDDGKITAKIFAMVGANLTGATAQFVASIEPILRIVLLLIQIVIGVATAIYIIRKVAHKK